MGRVPDGFELWHIKMKARVVCAFLFGIVCLLFSPLGVLAAVLFLDPDKGGGAAVILSGVVYLCGLALLIRSRLVAARQSQQCRRRFILGIVLVILAPLGLLGIAFYVTIAALGWGLGDAPASSFWSSPLAWKAGLAAAVPIVMFGFGVYQLIRSRSGPPD